MNINTVSFGKKIPIAKCTIKDRITKRCIPATCYEVDCTEESDYIEIFNLPRKWNFRLSVSDDMEKKYNMPRDYRAFNNRHFYTMQTDKDDKIVGICQTEEINEDLKLLHLEASPTKKYKYTGQGMLAILSTIAEKEKLKNIYIPFPVDTALTFYTDECGFKKCHSSSGLYMNNKRFGTFRNQVEKRMQAPILDVNI